jgi:hypothetical protein
MLIKKGLKIMGVLCTLLFVSEASAQNSASIYSALSIGEFNYSGLTHNQGMGGLGISYGSGWHANQVNPALTTRNTIFNFQAALNYDKINVSDGETKTATDGGGLSYLALSLPFKSGKITTGLGLSQLTSVNFRLQIASQVENSDYNAINFIEGDGGISEAYFNTGFVLAKNLSLGAQFSYLFGSTIRTNQLIIYDREAQEVGQPSEYYERLTVSDIGYKGGIYYFFKTSEKSNIHLGAIYQKLGNVNGNGFAKLGSIGQASNPNTDGDLIADNLKGDIFIPDRYGFGVSYEKANKYVIGLEGQYQDFSQYKNFFGESTELKETVKVGFGIQFVPDYLDFDNLLKRATYRFGAEFLQTPYYINQTRINDIGLNLGASFPVNQLSLVNFAMKVGQRGTIENGLIKENYVNFTLGFSLNDQTWFYKRVFE